MVTKVSLPRSRGVGGTSAELSDSPVETGTEISFIDVLIALGRRKRTIFAIMAAFTVISAVISLLLPKEYTAETTLLTPQQTSSANAVLSSQLGGMGGGMAALAGGALGFKNPNDMYVAMLQSRTVEEEMVRRFGLMQEYHSRFVSSARKMLEHHSTIDGSNKDGLIHVQVRDRDPERAAELANAYVQELRNLSQHIAITEASQRREFFQEQLEQAKDNLSTAEEELKKTEQQTGLIQPEAQARALIETGAALRAQITAKEVQIKSIEMFATGENAQLLQAEKELDSLRSQLAKLGGRETGSEAALIEPRGKITEGGVEYIRRLRDVKYQETIFEILARQFELAKLDEAREGALIQVIDRAVPPDTRSFPNRELIVVGATAAGLFFGIVWALAQAALEFWNSEANKVEKLRTLRHVLSLRSHTSHEV